jgi:hypothetical protein
MIDANQGVHLVQGELYASTIKGCQAGIQTTRKDFRLLISEKQEVLGLGYDLL